jgi:hypothetical protein
LLAYRFFRAFLSQFQFNRFQFFEMGKKRTREEAGDADEELTALDDSQLAEPDTKRQRNLDGLPTDKIDVWLVKKPKNVS